MELSNRVEELEDVEDRCDRRVNNMKGLLKNFHEVSKWQDEISQSYETVIRCSKSDMAAYRKKLHYHTRMLWAILAVLTFFSIEFGGAVGTSLVMTCVLLVVPFQESSRQNLPEFAYPTADLRVAKRKKEIEDAHKANDYIHEFLDSQ